MSKFSRSNRAFLNTISELLLEVVTAVCSFVLPRLLLQYYGSATTGVISSVAQFIGCVALLKSGIGSVTRAALYKPLAEKNYVEISCVVNSSALFLKKVGKIFGIFVLLFSAFYPFLVQNHFDRFFSFSLILILSASTFAQYYWGLAYQMVLQADQKNYVISLVTILSTIANTLFASLLIINGFEIRIVQLCSALVFFIPPLFYNFWVKKKYQIDSHACPDSLLIRERWNAMGHQLANFINSNLDVIIATIFLDITEVAVYAIFFMVGNAIRKVVYAIGAGTMAAFGNMLAKKETNLLQLRFSQFEILIFMISSILLSCSAVLMVPFVGLYTEGVSDANYIRPTFAIIVCIYILLMCVKMPYEQIVFSAGHFKNTRNGAFVEAALNLLLSLLFVSFWGLNGIVLGSVIAIVYRILRYNSYVSRNIIVRKPFIIYAYFVLSFFIVLFNYFIFHDIAKEYIVSAEKWVLFATIEIVVSTIFCAIVFYTCFTKQVKNLLFFLLKREK